LGGVFEGQKRRLLLNYGARKGQTSFAAFTATSTTRPTAAMSTQSTCGPLAGVLTFTTLPTA